ncbi:MAG: hypothetical protein EHM93_16940 [Bacteroidales bacterium]|nr:MAG: hypothetical protein EHM93_16940 [Bacteroidales bacterium]
MGNNTRFDAHCHIFTLKYVVKEVKSLLHDILHRTYPWTEPPTPKTLMATKGRFTELKELLRQLYEMLHSALSSEEDNLIFLQEEAKKEFPNDNLRIIPLMMDVFYMLAYPLDKDEDVKKVKGLRATAVDEKEFQECWDEILDDFSRYIQTQKTTLKASKGVTDDGSVRLALKIIDEERSVKKTLKMKTTALKSSKAGSFYPTEGYCYHMDKLMDLVISHKGQLFPFVAIDPRRPGIVDTLLTGSFFQGDRRFYGVKLYPRMGYHPQCKTMDAVYKYCSDNQLPITYHCGKGGFPPNTDWKYTKYGNPLNFEPIIKQYPSLKIDFAHMGSTDPSYDWAKTVARLVKENDNVYTDLSCYTGTDELNPMKAFWGEGTKLKTRLMFGTDFDVMYYTDRVTMKIYYDNFKQVFDPDVLWAMMHDTPMSFLGLRE